MRKRRVVGRIYGIKYSWKCHKGRNIFKNRIKRSGHARLVYVKDKNRNIPTTESTPTDFLTSTLSSNTDVNKTQKKTGPNMVRYVPFISEKKKKIDCSHNDPLQPHTPLAVKLGNGSPIFWNNSVRKTILLSTHLMPLAFSPQGHRVPAASKWAFVRDI